MSTPPDRKAPTKPAPPQDAASRDSDRPTLNPPFDVEAFARATAAAGAAPAGEGPPTVRADVRGEQITLTNEVEIEIARAKSRRRTIPPRRANTPTALSIANARVPSAPNVPAVRPSKTSARSKTPANVAAAPSPPAATAAAPNPSAATAARPSAPADAEPRSLSPSSIEAAVLGAIGGSPAPEITERTIEDPMAEMRERFSLGDYSGALEVAELLLAEDPADAEVIECADQCRTVLEGMYAARLGSLEQVPAVIVQRTQLRWLSIDHRAGFVLSLIDGSSSLEMILDVSGMPRLDAMRILVELIAQRIVALR
jgi:hypothetical protein